jgi:hypothetical protein
MRSPFLTNTIKPVSKMVAIALSLGWLTAGSAEAASFTFSKIVDTNTPMPGGGGNFTFLNTPVIDNGIVVFSGERDSQGRVEQRGIYTYAGGMLQTVVDTNTPVPFSDVNFIGFYLGLSIDQGNIVFGGSGNKPNPLGGTDVYGIYTVIGGVLDRVIDQSTILPGDNSNFKVFSGGGLSIKGRNVAFYGGSSSENVALFTNAGGTLQRVVDSSTPLPEVTSNLDSLSNADVVFASSTSLDGTIYNWRSGIYTYSGGVIKKIVDPATIMLGGRTDLQFSNPVVADNNDIAFPVVSYSNQLSTAIYTIVDGKVSLVADTNTPVPGGLGNLSNFTSFNSSSLSLDQGSVAFVGSEVVGFREFPGPICSPRQSCPGPIRVREIRNGIYTTLGGSLTKVIAEGEQLDGKIIAPYYLGVSRQMLSDNSLVFSVRFTDGSSGIYRADFVSHPPKSVPEPASVLGLLPAVGGLLLRGRKQGKKGVVKSESDSNF